MTQRDISLFFVVALSFGAGINFGLAITSFLSGRVEVGIVDIAFALIPVLPIWWNINDLRGRK